MKNVLGLRLLDSLMGARRRNLAQIRELAPASRRVANNSRLSRHCFATSSGHTQVMRFFVVTVLLLLSIPASAQVQPGDLVFQHSRSRQSRVIAEVTGSPWTHVGIVLERENELWVLEAVEPVRWAPFARWRRNGRRGEYEIRRSIEPLDADALSRLREVGEAFVGTEYDNRFEWGDQRIYCSELVWLMFERALGQELVQPQQWRSLRLSRAARRMARARLGGLPPPEGLLVTPVALLESELLFDPAE